jgi:hypothetical protein
MGKITEYSTITDIKDSDKIFVNQGNKLVQISKYQLIRGLLRPRYKDITSYFTDGSLWNRIAGTNGYSEYEDLYPGDYFDMGRAVTAPNVQEATSITTGSQWVTIASLGGLYYNGNSPYVNYNHLVMIPGKGYSGSFHFGIHRMNPTDTTSGGCAGSEMFTKILGDVVTSGSVDSGATINQQLYYIFGSHLKTTNELLSNAINATGYNRFGTNSGCSSGFTWKNVQACLMSEIEVYGSVVWSSSGYDIGTAKRQFEVFAMDERTINNRSSYYWLKDVASASSFADAGRDGGAGCDSASYAGCCVRPRFVLA